MLTLDSFAKEKNVNLNTKDYANLPFSISIVIALDTTSREAKSLATGAYFSMKNSPLELMSLPPSPRVPSVISIPLP